MKTKGRPFPLQFLVQSYIGTPPNNHRLARFRRDTLEELHQAIDPFSPAEQAILIDHFVTRLENNGYTSLKVAKARQIIKHPPIGKIKEQLEEFEQKFPGISSYIPLIIYENNALGKKSLLHLSSSVFFHPITTLGQLFYFSSSNKHSIMSILAEKYNMSKTDRRSFNILCITIGNRSRPTFREALSTRPSANQASIPE